MESSITYFRRYSSFNHLASLISVMLNDYNVFKQVFQITSSTDVHCGMDGVIFPKRGKMNCIFLLNQLLDLQ